jgi:DNA polymerase-3 subunit gamma/tau
LGIDTYLELVIIGSYFVMTFYLKYRPQTLAELDLTNVRESLEKIVASGKIPHALLFSGPKGLGKTSAARILAKAVNCEKIVTGDKRQTAGFEPCNKCGQCLSITKGTNLDVIELDAASHRGIDDIRILRDAVKLAPATARKKVYIIDEAHMLTTEAVNALLKTLEEPPSHVMFVLATTNPEKLIGTIRSRVTEIPFKKATIEETLRSLARVVAGEKIKIEKGALEEIAKKAAGSLRDATKILEQLVIEDRNFDAKSVAEFLFRAQTFDLDNFLVLLAKKDVKAAILEIENVSRSGLETELLVKSLLERFRLSLLAKVGVGEDSLEFFNKER